MTQIPTCNIGAHTIRRAWRPGLFAVLVAVAWFGVIVPPNPAHAQSDAAGYLKDVESKLRRSKTRKADLALEANALMASIATLGKKLVATATGIQTLEAQVSFTETRLVGLTRQERLLRRKFTAKRAMLADILAGLQRLEQNPPPALAVRPEDALSALRGAMLLGTVVPEIRAEANKLARTLGELTTVRATIASEQVTLSANLATLQEGRVDIKDLLLEKRVASQITQAEIEAEALTAEKLSREAASLKDLIAKLGPNAPMRPAILHPETDKPALLRAELRRQAALLRPAKQFSKARGTLNYPVQGMRISEFGADDRLGGILKGQSIGTRRNAQVITPVDGHVVYSGPFRSYGQLLIINAGEGYHIILAGMERINVAAGQFVLAGEPVGAMGENAKGSTITDGVDSRGKPILYIEFRKDGTSVDPAPWWAGNAQKVRG